VRRSLTPETRDLLKKYDEAMAWYLRSSDIMTWTSDERIRIVEKAAGMFGKKAGEKVAEWLRRKFPPSPTPEPDPDDEMADHYRKVLEEWDRTAPREPLPFAPSPLPAPRTEGGC
jgi:hypothetical protein